MAIVVSKEELGKRFRRVKHVVTPLLKIKPDVEYYIKITGPMFVGRKVEEKKEPATLCNILDLSREPPEEMQLICGAVFKGALRDEYPGDSYVGKSFAFEITKPPTGEDGAATKRYNLIKTFIEIDASEAPKAVKK